MHAAEEVEEFWQEERAQAVVTPENRVRAESRQINQTAELANGEFEAQKALTSSGDAAPFSHRIMLRRYRPQTCFLLRAYGLFGYADPRDRTLGGDSWLGMRLIFCCAHSFTK